MISEYYTSYNCIDFVKGSVASVSTNLLADIREFIAKNKNLDDFNDFLTVLESEFATKSTTDKKFKYHEINYGFEPHGSFKIQKNLYLMDLYDIIWSYISNPELQNLLNRNYCSNDPQILKSFFDGSFYKNLNDNGIKTLYMGIYADEINLINPIGNSLFYCIN